ncbi:MAG: site-specific integrase, partial [Chlorobi bacterium]|nr:site-specific integrase [Chlorobiota bacterium]
MLNQSYKSGFRQYLKLERGLSSNTIDAYLHDVDLLFHYLDEPENKKNIKQATIEDLRGFLAFINEMKLGPVSQARIISGIKSFYRFLMLEKVVRSDPSELLESPRLGRKLPEVLTPDEVIKIIDSVDLSKPEGERDKAILEVLYGCGLRVSEVIGLHLSDLHFNEGLIVVTGKGSKQRLVPVGDAAQKQINIYKDLVRTHQNPKKKAEDILFLNNR